MQLFLKDSIITGNLLKSSLKSITIIEIGRYRLLFNELSVELSLFFCCKNLNNILVGTIYDHESLHHFSL